MKGYNPRPFAIRAYACNPISYGNISGGRKVADSDQDFVGEGIDGDALASFTV